MPLNYIFHLSDLHIRNGDNTYSRYEEYREVFKRTIISINSNIVKYKLSFDNFIIVITGDIFHNKNVIGNYGLFIYREFIQSLSKIGRIYIISGNHDYDQSDINKPSLVYSSTFDIPNVFVLNTTTSFVIDDIGFSFVSIDKTLDKYRNSGRIQDLPAFPLLTDKVKYKIALFHGSFASAKLYNGNSIEETFNPYPLEWVKDFDYVLLGDIHKRQVFNYKKKTICGYSGSLIQQNFGEDIIEHGYLIWNIENKQVDEINVYNDIGYINIMEDASHNIYIRTNGKYTEILETYIKNNINYFPKILEIKSFSNINYESLCNILKAFNISFQILSKLSNQSNKNTIIKQNYNINEEDNKYKKEVLDTNYLLDYFKKLLSEDKYKILLKIIKDKETLLFDIYKYPEDLHNECIKRNKDLEPIINSCDEANEVHNLKKSFLIKYLEWEGLLCYENKNWVNFKDLDAKTFMIKGSNGTGKSAIYDILQLAIWATNNKFDTYSSGFINHNKDKGYTIVDIEIDNVTYRIKREFCKKKNTFKITNKTSVLSKFTDISNLVILKKDSACNLEVKTLFGDINTFLSTSMITQGVDNDILSLNYKDTLETIDKSHNIQFIYHLYNLFKTAINKYKDFRKVIQSKKEVYEKLLFNCNNVDINDTVISQLEEELSLLNNEKNILIKKYDAINIDINNPYFQSIVDTDYISLIDGIVTNNPNIIVSNDTYLIYKDKMIYYKYSLNNVNDIHTLVSLYTEELEDKFNKLPCINKPCDMKYLCNEENELSNYINIENEDNSYDEELLGIQHDELFKNKKLLNELITNKPAKVSMQYPCKSIEDITSIILNIYGNNDVFNEFISSNNKPSIIDQEILKKLKDNINNPINIEYYKNTICYKETILNDINNIKITLATLEKDFNKLFSKQQQLKIINIPCNVLNYKEFKTSVSIVKELKYFNIDVINKQIADDKIILNEYYNIIEKINELDIEIDSYNKELILLSTNDDYRYNPECCICCNRPWVLRIKELGIIINTLNINRESINYSENDFVIVKERFEENNATREKYNLLNEWYDYYKSKEVYEKVSNNLKIIINSKNNLNEELISKNIELKTVTDYTEYFISYSFMLFEEINNIRLFDIYNIWENNYNNTKSLIENLEKSIHYNDIIKPRISKYIELKKNYDDWVKYDGDKRIIDSYHYIRLKKVIEINDLYNEYQNKQQIKPQIKQKIELNDLVASRAEGIKKLNDTIVKYTTINTYNNENKTNYNLLVDIDRELENIIDVLDTILINFQSFRKELYDNLILTKLVDKTNKIIKTLCHSNTKPFKLNYNVDISNDTVHINWLIHNDNISKGCDDKQYISVSQASGFQRFVISLALRMSLYFNNYEVFCNQLFIDEGFINFDKNNLSIVPSFLKSLLHYFNTIVILSHIDIIQDSVDETAVISFNNINGISALIYG
jgi:DNA repair exonuclease SbcCD nuclease subunit/DNA repair exonuclease SbcCD ATPase subunit